MKVMTIVGARPQFIKAATVSRVFREYSDCTEILVHTGQHFDANMSEIFFEQMDIPRPDYTLEVSGGGHGQMTGKMLQRLEPLMEQHRPDWVLVYGDTNSTLAGAITAAKLRVPLAHVEAGLRSYNFDMPEEINRVVTDRVSQLLFCPTLQAVKNLEAEGYPGLGVEMLEVGDVMFDAVQLYRKRARRPVLPPSLDAKLPFAIATIHRAENTEAGRLSRIIAALEQVHAQLPILLPLHPRTRIELENLNLSPSVHVVDPLGYFEMLWLLERCRLVLTDSGGLQKEAWFFQRPCITLRPETEWTELVEIGANRLVDVETDPLTDVVFDILEQNIDFSAQLYGDGKAAQRIVERIRSPARSQNSN